MEDIMYRMHRYELDMGRLESLINLMDRCKEEGVEVRKVVYTQNGYMVLFEGLPGDAVLHDASYGRMSYEWESIGMPWDDEDVSVHDGNTLAKMLGALKRGEDWEQYNS